MTGFITVTDAEVKNRHYPDGRPVMVRASSIDSIRPYAEGRVRCVLGIHGSYLHVRETEEQIMQAIVQAGG